MKYMWIILCFVMAALLLSSPAYTQTINSYNLKGLFRSDSSNWIAFDISDATYITRMEDIPEGASSSSYVLDNLNLNLSSIGTLHIDKSGAGFKQIVIHVTDAEFLSLTISSMILAEGVVANIYSPNLVYVENNITSNSKSWDINEDNTGMNKTDKYIIDIHFSDAAQLAASSLLIDRAYVWLNGGNERGVGDVSPSFCGTPSNSYSPFVNSSVMLELQTPNGSFGFSGTAVRNLTDENDVINEVLYVLTSTHNLCQNNANPCSPILYNEGNTTLKAYIGYQVGNSDDYTCGADYTLPLPRKSSFARWSEWSAVAYTNTPSQDYSYACSGNDIALIKFTQKERDGDVKKLALQVEADFAEYASIFCLHYGNHPHLQANYPDSRIANDAPIDCRYPRISGGFCQIRQTTGVTRVSDNRYYADVTGLGSLSAGSSGAGLLEFSNGNTDPGIIAVTKAASIVRDYNNVICPDIGSEQNGVFSRTDYLFDPNLQVHGPGSFNSILQCEGERDLCESLTYADDEVIIPCFPEDVGPIVEDLGDQDGFYEPNETLNLSFSIMNSSDELIEGMTISISSGACVEVDIDDIFYSVDINAHSIHRINATCFIHDRGNGGESDYVSVSFQGHHYADFDVPIALTGQSLIVLGGSECYVNWDGVTVPQPLDDNHGVNVDHDRIWGGEYGTSTIVGSANNELNVGDMMRVSFEVWIDRFPDNSKIAIKLPNTLSSLRNNSFQDPEIINLQIQRLPNGFDPEDENIYEFGDYISFNVSAELRIGFDIIMPRESSAFTNRDLSYIVDVIYCSSDVISREDYTINDLLPLNDPIQPLRLNDLSGGNPMNIQLSHREYGDADELYDIGEPSRVKIDFNAPDGWSGQVRAIFEPSTDAVGFTYLDEPEPAESGEWGHGITLSSLEESPGTVLGKYYAIIDLHRNDGHLHRLGYVFYVDNSVVADSGYVLPYVPSPDFDFRNAIEDAANGDTINLPPGAHYCDEQLCVFTSVNIIGDPIYNSTLVGSVACSNANTETIRLENLTFINRNGCALLLTGGFNVDLYDCRFNDCQFSVNASSGPQMGDLRLEKCKIRGLEGNCLKGIEAANINIDIVDCRIENAGSGIIGLDSEMLIENSVINGCKDESNGIGGIKLEDCNVEFREVKISNCRSTANLGVGGVKMSGDCHVDLNGLTLCDNFGQEVGEISVEYDSSLPSNPEIEFIEQESGSSLIINRRTIQRGVPTRINVNCIDGPIRDCKFISHLQDSELLHLYSELGGSAEMENVLLFSESDGAYVMLDGVDLTMDGVTIARDIAFYGSGSSITAERCVIDVAEGSGIEYSGQNCVDGSDVNIALTDDGSLSWKSPCLDMVPVSVDFPLEFDNTRGDLGWKEKLENYELTQSLMSEPLRRANYSISADRVLSAGALTIPAGSTIKVAAGKSLNLLSMGGPITIGDSNGPRTAIVAGNPFLPLLPKAFRITIGDANQPKPATINGVLFNCSPDVGYSFNGLIGAQLIGNTAENQNVEFRSSGNHPLSFVECENVLVKGFTFHVGSETEMNRLNNVLSNLTIEDCGFTSTLAGDQSAPLFLMSPTGTTIKNCTFTETNSIQGSYPSCYQMQGSAFYLGNQLTSNHIPLLLEYATATLANNAVNHFTRGGGPNLGFDNPLIRTNYGSLDLKCGYNTFVNPRALSGNNNTGVKFISSVNNPASQADWEKNFWGTSATTSPIPCGNIYQYVPNWAAASNCLGEYAPPYYFCPQTDNEAEELWIAGQSAELTMQNAMAIWYYSEIVRLYPKSKQAALATVRLKALGKKEGNLKPEAMAALVGASVVSASQGDAWLSLTQMTAAQCLEARYGDQCQALGTLDSLVQTGDPLSMDLATLAVLEINTYPPQGGLSGAPADGGLARLRAQEDAIQALLAFQPGQHVQVPGVVVPASFQISKIYPNPFNPTTRILVEVPEKAHVLVRVFDLLGRQVKVLADREMQTGRCELVLDGSDMASGMYLVQAEAGSAMTTQKVMLLK